MKRETLERPAFLLYASNIMAKREWRSMAFDARGLWASMLMECWTNQEIPSGSNGQLACYLGTDDAELQRLLPHVMWYFEAIGDDIICPALEKYRDEQDARVAKQKAGGIRGAAKTNSTRKPSPDKAIRQPASNPTSNPQVPRRANVGSLSQIKPNQTKPTQSLGKDLPSTDKGESPAYTEWMSEGKGKPSINDDYERMSNGY